MNFLTKAEKKQLEINRQKWVSDNRKYFDKLPDGNLCYHFFYLDKKMIWDRKYPFNLGDLPSGYVKVYENGLDDYNEVFLECKQNLPNWVKEQFAYNLIDFDMVENAYTREGTDENVNFTKYLFEIKLKGSLKKKFEMLKSNVWFDSSKNFKERVEFYISKNI